MQDYTKQPIDFAAEVRDDMLRERSEMIQSISGNLISMVPKDASIRRLAEDIFSSVFLPMFLGKPNPRYPDISAGNWATLAGSPHTPVDVVNVQGEVVFQVPPLVQSQLLAPITGKLGVDMSFVTNQARLYSSSLPQVAENYLREELTKRTSLMKSDADTEETLTAWKKILTFYGLLTADTSTQSSNKPVVDLDYEDIPP